MNEQVTFSMYKIKQVYVLQQMEERKLSGREAAKRLGLSLRQVRRLLEKYCREGASGLEQIRARGSEVQGMQTRSHGREIEPEAERNPILRRPGNAWVKGHEGRISCRPAWQASRPVL